MKSRNMGNHSSIQLNTGCIFYRLPAFFFLWHPVTASMLRGAIEETACFSHLKFRRSFLQPNRWFLLKIWTLSMLLPGHCYKKEQLSLHICISFPNWPLRHFQWNSIFIVYGRPSCIFCLQHLKLSYADRKYREQEPGIATLFLYSPASLVGNNMNIWELERNVSDDSKVYQTFVLRNPPFLEAKCN
jgi:hypothetical protein